MDSRRSILKKSGIAFLSMLVASPLLAAKEAMMKILSFPGVIYTQKEPGRWKALTKLHVPVITVKGSQVTIFTDHPMTKPHYIVKHTLVDEKGEVIGDKTFVPTDPKAISTHTLPSGFKGKLYATSFCNLHDFWVKEFDV